MQKKIMLNIKTINELGIIIVLAAICVLIALVNQSFYSWINIVNILRTSSYLVIVGIAVTFVFISGGLDLTVGSLIGLGGLITAICMKHFNMPVPLSIAAGVFVGALFGVFNGVIIVKLKIPAMIVTLGSMYIARGIMNVVTKGKPVFPLPAGFNLIGSGAFLRIPYSVWFAAALALLAVFVLNHTVYGRYVYCVGGNNEASRLSGINVDMVKISVYVLSAVCATFSGIIMTSRITSAQISLGLGWEMTIIAAVIIGGTSMFGGTGTILGTVIGAVLLSVISNGIVLMGISTYWQNIVTGIIIILAVGIDHYKRRKTGDIE